MNTRSIALDAFAFQNSNFKRLDKGSVAQKGMTTVLFGGVTTDWRTQPSLSKCVSGKLRLVVYASKLYEPLHQGV